MVQQSIKQPVFAIGDIQGCYRQLRLLVTKIDEFCLKHRGTSSALPAQLWLVGDLVNRGPQSLEVLRWCMSNQHRLKVVLGNHDLHCLAVAAGVRTARPDDTFNEILNAPDRNQLLGWLRRQPLAHLQYGWLIVHAGVLPQWTAEATIALSREVSVSLQSNDWQEFLSSMYGNQPSQWRPDLRDIDRSRVIINALTRLRFCNDAGEMEFATKESAEHAPVGYKPWFTVPNRVTRDQPIVFGHWSTLGLINDVNLVATDTGCVWGGALSAVEICSPSHSRAVLRVAAGQT